MSITVLRNFRTIDSLAGALSLSRGENFEDALRVIGHADLADSLHSAEKEKDAYEVSLQHPASLMEALSQRIDPEQDRLFREWDSAHQRAKAAADEWLVCNYGSRPDFDGAPC